MILILSGPSGSGKTSACAIIARKAAEAGAAIAGVICGAVFEGGRKVGIDWTDLASGPGAAPRLLARVKPGIDAAAASGARADTQAAGRTSPAYDDSYGLVIGYGMWEFDRAALAAADESASRGIANSAATSAATSADTGDIPGIAIVDEIGPLELDRGVGMVRTLAALDGAARQPDAGAAFIVVARPDIAERLASRWPGSIVKIITGLTAEQAADDALASCRQAFANTIANTPRI